MDLGEIVNKMGYLVIILSIVVNKKCGISTWG